jgi:hypothetical protein
MKTHLKYLIASSLVLSVAESDLPAVPVTEMRYHEGTNTLTIATFGHGIQRVVLP